jgi:hypothetical protein
MITVSLQSFLESLLGTPAGAKTPAAKPGDFSSLLASGGAMPVDPTGKATDALADPGATPSPLTSDAAAASSSAPSVYGLVSQPANGTPSSDLALAPATVETFTEQPTDQKSDVGVALSSNNPAVPARIELSDVPPEPLLDVRAHAQKTTRTVPGADAADPDATQLQKADDAKLDGGHDVNPATLTMQQALAAAALLSGPPAHQQQQTTLPGLVVAQDSSAALPITKNPRPAGRMAGSPLVAEGVAARDMKTAGPAMAALTSIQPHSLALLLDQQTPAKLPIHDGAGPLATLSSSTDVATSGASQSPDLHQLDALVRDIAELSGSTGRAAMRITGDQLGPLDIRLHRSDAGMTVSIRTQSEQSHSTVVQAQQQLSDDLRANGLKVAATSVMLGQGGTGTDRHDRQPLPFAPPIEAATTQAEQDHTTDEERPAGRYA